MNPKITLIGTILAVSALSIPLVITEFSPKPQIPNAPDLELIGKVMKLECSELVIYYLLDNSSLLDEEFNGPYLINAAGLPDGLSQEELDKCVQIILEKRDSP